jgi:hypothetical protein
MIMEMRNVRILDGLWLIVQFYAAKLQKSCRVTSFLNIFNIIRIFAPANLTGNIRLIMQRTVFKVYGLILLAMALFPSCSKKSAPASSGTGSAVQVAAPGPPCIIYKTRADFSRLIPVELSEDKTQLASFPDVADIYREGELAYPTTLNNGFLLDNRGIGPNVAFLKLTYDDYRKLDGTPPAAELMENILERDPLTEMYQCGNRSQYKDVVSELNQLISSGRLAECKKLK